MISYFCWHLDYIHLCFDKGIVEKKCFKLRFSEYKESDMLLLLLSVIIAFNPVPLLLDIFQMIN